MAQVDYWNHNVHYQPVILRAVPAGCGAALEVGCGDGMLARRLAERCAEVTAIDRDARMITLASTRNIRLVFSRTPTSADHGGKTADRSGASRPCPRPLSVYSCSALPHAARQRVTG
jgi:SAM-dependent methyltransferase